MITRKGLVRWLMKDKDQVGIIKSSLVDVRKGSLKEYIKAGIFYSSQFGDGDMGEVSYIAEQLGVTEEEFGVTKENKWLFEEGFIVPVWGIRNELLFYINYDYRRDKSKKYLNIYTNFYDRKEVEMKMYGLHNTKKAIEQDRIVVVEGLFDCIRLGMYGIPAVAVLGTKIMTYHKLYYKRFKRVIYIPDNDGSGESAARKFREQVPNSEIYRIEGTYGDVDDFGKSGTREFEEWVKKLQAYGNKGIE